MRRRDEVERFVAGVERELDRLESEEADRAWLESWHADQARRLLEALADDAEAEAAGWRRAAESVAREDPAADRSPGPPLRPSP